MTITTIDVTIGGKPCFRHIQNRRLNEDEVHAIVTEGMIGINPEQAEVNVFFETKTN